MLFVGSAGLRKGIHTLGQASQELSTKSYSFDVAGDVTDAVRMHPLTSVLEFLGRVPRVEVVRKYEQADVMVLPSLAEGSAEVTYEALAAGIPVITTHQAGSVIRDGIDGFIVPASDPRALAQRIGRVAGSGNKLQRMAIAARERASEFTWEKYQDRLTNTLLTIPSNRH